MDESHTVWGPHGGPKGLPTDPFAAKNPLISLADTVRLATEAGFTNLNRADWGEPPFSSGTDVPLWTVEYYHPMFSREPDASKTTYIYHAQTGWLVTSEVSIPNSNETYEGKALALKWRD